MNPSAKSVQIPRGQLYFDPLATMRTLAQELPAGTGYGPICREFEAAVCGELGSPNAFVLPHARVALYYLLKALDLPARSEVLMTPVTIPDMVNVIVMCGLRPVFVDLDQQTCNIDYGALEKQISEKSKLVLITHLCGFPSDMKRVMKLAQKHKLEVLEDCSQVMGGTADGELLGRFGRAGIFSLTTLKPVSTFQGGLVITNDTALDAQLREMSAALPQRSPTSLWKLFARDLVLYSASHPRIFELFTHHIVRQLNKNAPDWVESVQRGEVPGSHPYNLAAVARNALGPQLLVQYTDAQAAMGLQALKTLRPGNDIRRSLAMQLYNALSEGPAAAGLPHMNEVAPDDCTFWRFPYWVDQKEAFRDFLRDRGVDTACTNLLCLSTEPAFSDWAADTPEASRYIHNMIFLPIHPNQSEDDMAHVADTVHAWFATMEN